jgi:putative restriction endonuclease
MNAFVALTDYRWFTFLASLPKLEEINFWQPSGRSAFSAVKPGELFLFKLHSPREYIAGSGFFAHYSQLPVSLAWDAFGIANGAVSLETMRAQIEKYRKQKTPGSADYTIGCILLSQPFFFKESDWIPAPRDWSPNIVQGKHYDLSIEPGLSLFRQLQERLSVAAFGSAQQAVVEPAKDKYGAPVEILPRLGQGIFRVVITDAYERRCAVTSEKVLPVLVAGHIKPYAKEGTHNPNNGILLRSDLHTLFDLGYATITPEHRFEVSRQVREEYENGHEYYALQGQEIFLPGSPGLRPSRENLSWHNENVYRG